MILKQVWSLLILLLLTDFYHFCQYSTWQIMLVRDSFANEMLLLFIINGLMLSHVCYDVSSNFFTITSYIKKFDLQTKTYTIQLRMLPLGCISFKGKFFTEVGMYGLGVCALAGS